MSNTKFNDTFLEVLNHNGVVSITTWANGDAHVSNTWNSYLTIVDGDTILIPAAWLNKTEANIIINNKVIVTLGSQEVEGKLGMGTGFVLEGTASFLTDGEHFNLMKEKFSFATRVLAVKVETVKQTI